MFNRYAPFQSFKSFEELKARKKQFERFGNSRNGYHRYPLWLSRGDAPPGRAGRWDVRVAESSETYGGEFAQENEALTPENTIPWRKFAETVDR
jgi:hypothetical protein